MLHPLEEITMARYTDFPPIESIAKFYYGPSQSATTLCVKTAYAVSANGVGLCGPIESEDGCIVCYLRTSAR